MKGLSYVAFLAACLCLASAAPVEDGPAPTPLAEPENYRLPQTILPAAYEITLRPYLLNTDPVEKQFTFDGEVFIEINPQVTTDNITMHTKNLKYSKREMWAKSNPNAKWDLPEGTLNNVTDIITYKVNSSLTPESGPYILHFIYSGTMDDDMHGFYRSNYTDSNNNTKWLGSTQFQTNHARRAFPSFDEPLFKAEFTVTIKRHKSMKSVSCSPLVQSTLEGDYYTDVFAKTPKMSTYILAFIVSEFNERSDGTFSVLARPEYYDQTEYPFEVGKKTLAALDEYLDIKYYEMGVNKMHLAAIPDFSAGAMENWGLLTYRERALLYKEGSSTLSSKQYIAAVIVHEQAHMWFGDLVTAHWWSYTWLNEGFARYFQYFGTAMVETDLQMDKQFPVDQIQSVMGMDATNNTNPMTDENTNTPADLSRMFNSITYNKGGTVIRMVEHCMGKENFQKSLQEYLKKYQYQNTKPPQLLEIWSNHWLDQTTKQYLEPMFKSFTEQVGYPLITVEMSSDGKSFTIAQKRFLLKSNDQSNASLLYTVPITYTTDAEKKFDNTMPKEFLTATTDKKTISLSNSAKWVILNIQQTAYYRVNYDNNTWHQIHSALASSEWGGILDMNRAQIVDDLFNLARAGVIGYELALDILEYLNTETNYLPWTAAFNGFNYLAIRLGTNAPNFNIYIRDLMDKAYQALGFEEKPTDSTLDIYARTKLVSWSCKYGNSECIERARKYFDDMDHNPVPVNIRAPVYCTIMREGSADDFEKLYRKYKTETVATEETLLLNSLGCVKDKALVERVFHMIISAEVRRQDKSAALSSLYTENSENVTPVFELVTGNYKDVANAMGGLSDVASVISNIASRFTEESQQKKLQDFNAQHKAEFGNSAATLEAAERTVAENLKWDAERLGYFKSYLTNYGKSGASSISRFSLLTFALVALVARLLK